MLKKTIFGHFGPKRPILDHFCPKRGHFRIFGEKEKTSLFYSFFSFFNTKNQKILIRRFSGKWARTNERTDERTEVNPKVHRLRRETKDDKFLKWKCLFEKNENFSLFLLNGRLRP